MPPFAEAIYPRALNEAANQQPLLDSIRLMHLALNVSKPHLPAPWYNSGIGKTTMDRIASVQDGRRAVEIAWATWDQPVQTTALVADEMHGLKIVNSSPTNQKFARVSVFARTPGLSHCCDGTSHV